MNNIARRFPWFVFLLVFAAVPGCQSTGEAPGSGTLDVRSSKSMELVDRCQALEKRVAELEAALDVRGIPRGPAEDFGPPVQLSPEILREADLGEEEALRESLVREESHSEAVREPSPGDEPKALYGAALDLTRKGEVARGRSLFQEFLNKYPQHADVPNALYWLGETYYREGNFPEAILVFKDVPARFGKHDKAPASLLKMGFAYEKLGDRENARFYLRTLQETYPGSEPAKLGQARLRALGQ